MILFLNACMRREWQNEVNFCNKKIRSYLLPRPDESNTHDNDIFYSIKIIFTFRTCLCNTVKQKITLSFPFAETSNSHLQGKINIDFHLFSTTTQPGAQTNPSM